MIKNDNILKKTVRYISYTLGLITGLAIGLTYMVLKILLAILPYVIVLGLVVFGFFKVFG